jgi:putative oxidoreductase
MICVKHTVKKWYQAEIWALDHVKHLFLLILRLYFGWGFMSAGLGKLLNVETHTGFFRDWGIPLPMFNVYMAGTTETVCGFLLLIGAASRIITIPLIGTMFVAYLTAHTEQLYALWGNTPLFFKAPPFPYLFTCFVVLLFGPGLLSVDGLVKWLLERRKPGSPEASGGAANGHRTSSSPPVLIGQDMTTFSSRGEQ